MDIAVIVFVVAFFVLIISSYMIGKGDRDENKELREAGGVFLILSLLVMVGAWGIRWKTELPYYAEDFAEVWDILNVNPKKV